MFLLNRKGPRKSLLNLIVKFHPHLGLLAALDIIVHSLLQIRSLVLQGSAQLVSSYLNSYSFGYFSLCLISPSSKHSNVLSSVFDLLCQSVPPCLEISSMYLFLYYSTQSSKVVSHPNTIQAGFCLASEISQDWASSEWHGHRLQLFLTYKY